jgi:hypothetical protein
MRHLKEPACEHPGRVWAFPAERLSPGSNRHTVSGGSGLVYAQKLQVEIVIEGQRRAAPLEWLDSFCMRNFTGSAEFDDTLPTAEGRLEAGLRVEPSRLAQAMSAWFTTRGKGNGKPVRVEIRQAN